MSGAILRPRSVPRTPAVRYRLDGHAGPAVGGLDAHDATRQSPASRLESPATGRHPRSTPNAGSLQLRTAPLGRARRPTAERRGRGPPHRGHRRGPRPGRRRRITSRSTAAPARCGPCPPSCCRAGAPVVDRPGRRIRPSGGRAWSRRRDEIAAAHASCRLEGYRIDAALERARDRLPLPGATLRNTETRTPAPARVQPVPPPAPESPRPRGRAGGRARRVRAPRRRLGQATGRRTAHTRAAAADAAGHARRRSSPSRCPKASSSPTRGTRTPCCVQARAAADALPPEAAGPSIDGAGAARERGADRGRAGFARDVSDERPLPHRSRHTARSVTPRLRCSTRSGAAVAAARAQVAEAAATELRVLAEDGLRVLRRVPVRGHRRRRRGRACAARLAAETELADGPRRARSCAPRAVGPDPPRPRGTRAADARPCHRAVGAGSRRGSGGRAARPRWSIRSGARRRSPRSETSSITGEFPWGATRSRPRGRTSRPPPPIRRRRPTGGNRWPIRWPPQPRKREPLSRRSKGRLRPTPRQWPRPPSSRPRSKLPTPPAGVRSRTSRNSAAPRTASSRTSRASSRGSTS